MCGLIIGLLELCKVWVCRILVGSKFLNLWRDHVVWADDWSSGFQNSWCGAKPLAFHQVYPMFILTQSLRTRRLQAGKCIDEKWWKMPKFITYKCWIKSWEHLDVTAVLRPGCKSCSLWWPKCLTSQALVHCFTPTAAGNLGNLSSTSSANLQTSLDYLGPFDKIWQNVVPCALLSLKNVTANIVTPEVKRTSRRCAPGRIGDTKCSSSSNGFRLVMNLLINSNTNDNQSPWMAIVGTFIKGPQSNHFWYSLILPYAKCNGVKHLMRKAHSSEQHKDYRAPWFLWCFHTLNQCQNLPPKLHMPKFELRAQRQNPL